MHAQQPAIRQFGDLVLGLATAPPKRTLRRAYRRDSVIHSPILDIQGDIVWFFAHFGTLKNIDMLWLEVGEAEADRTLPRFAKSEACSRQAILRFSGSRFGDSAQDRRLPQLTTNTPSIVICIIAPI
jgi:hypothetical protein